MHLLSMATSCVLSSHQPRPSFPAAVDVRRKCEQQRRSPVSNGDSMMPYMPREGARPATWHAKLEACDSVCMSALDRTPSGYEHRAPAFTATIAAALLLTSAAAYAPAAHADPVTTFRNTCAACHAGGGNVLGGPTLSLEDLKRNGVFEAEPLYDVIYGGKRRMPGYGVSCQPKGQCTFGARLSDEEIQGLAGYVREQAELGWPIPAPE